jgi:hypothetical protein
MALERKWLCCVNASKIELPRDGTLRATDHVTELQQEFPNEAA